MTTRQLQVEDTLRSANPAASTVSYFLRRQFIAYGILPILLVVLIVTFAVFEPRFISWRNLINIARQLSYLGIIAVAQMMYLITRNYDLSNGSTVALTSIVAASVMSSVSPESPYIAILLGCLAGLAVGLVIGIVNTILVAYMKIHSFMVTLGTASIATGIALMISGGVPVTGLPREFSATFGIASVMGIPVPALMLVIVVVLVFVLLNWMRVGRQAYAVGGNESAAFQSGVNVQRTLLSMMLLGSLLASIVGLMLTARVSSGEANLGLQYPLLAITACVIGGISLSGGQGRISGAVMGALFLILLSNGMDLVRIQSYAQDIALGILLALALLVDRLRERVRLQSR